MNKQDIITLWASFDIPRDDVFLMIQNIMNISAKDLFLLSDIDDTYVPRIKNVFQDRQSGIPLEYILWETEFYGHRFLLNKNTLIPKNDTEVLVEKTIEYISSQTNTYTLVDIWTWTGCIPISVLKKSWENIPKAYAVDISSDVLDIAKQNISLHWLNNKIDIFEGDLFAPLQEKVFTHLVVTANLPYILDNDLENIDKQVLDHEPHLALFWGKKTWFELYEKLVRQLQDIQAESIILFIEIGFDQWKIVRDFCKKQQIDFNIYKDNGWIERCVQMKIC